MHFYNIVIRVTLIAALCCVLLACSARTNDAPPPFDIASKTIDALQHAAVLANASLLPNCLEVRCSQETELLIDAVRTRIKGNFAESNRYANACSQPSSEDQALAGMICAQMLFDQTTLMSGYGAAAAPLRKLINMTSMVCTHGVNTKTYPNVRIVCADHKNRELLLHMPTQAMNAGVKRAEYVPLFGYSKDSATISDVAHYPTLEVRVNRVPLRMIVDTGSLVSMLNVDELGKVGIRVGAAMVDVHDISGAERSQKLVNIRHMQIGGATFGNVPGVVLNSLTGTGIDGVLGLNVLEKIGSFAFEDGKFYIHPIIPQNAQCVSMSIGSTLAGPGFRIMLGGATFNGGNVTAFLDTGSVSTNAALTPYFVRTHHRTPHITQQTVVIGSLRRYRVGEGSVAGHLNVLDRNYGDRAAYDGGELAPVDVVVGAQALMQRNVAIDLDMMRACTW